MKRILSIMICMVFLISMLSGCGEKTLLDPDEPVTITMWHVYGEQADSPMNKLAEEFNKTVGMEKGIIIDITAISNSTDIGNMLLDAQAGKPGVGEMPDLFFCHTNNADSLGAENLIDWKTLFSEDELSGFVDAFTEDGMLEDRLAVLPVSKSTHLLFVNGNEFERFSTDTGVRYEDMSTWEGFFDVSEQYYEWSDGKAFCALDYPLRCIELNALAEGAEFMAEDGWYDFDSKALRDSWMEFALPLAEGHVKLSDLYANTQVMTGEVAAGVSSSAAVLYYNDIVTYPDNRTEPLDVEILPLPQNPNGDALATQAGVGLCAYQTTEQKAEAISVFAHWFTESRRNLDFVADTGYMPVTKDGLDAISEYDFEEEAYHKLYRALQETGKTCVMVREPSYAGYYDKVYQLYDGIRRLQDGFEERREKGASAEKLAEETWTLFRTVK